MALSISSTAALLPRGSELSACSLLTCLTSRKKVNSRLMLLCLCSSYGASLSGYGCCISAGSSPLATSTSLSLPLFLAPFVIPIRVRGDVLG